ncbi:MAG: VanZ family protein [Kiritimatiellae bacterium]|nr:VanZ family protein [Kiritimatiellia bacterium]
MNRHAGGAKRWIPYGWSMRVFFAAMYTALLAVLSLVPKSRIDRVPRFFPGEDKLAHFVAYGLYAVILLRVLGACGNHGRWKSVMLVTTWCTGYGILLELLQAAFPQIGRAFSFIDMLANTGGAFLFSAVTSRHPYPGLQDGDSS